MLLVPLGGVVTLVLVTAAPSLCLRAFSTPFPSGMQAYGRYHPPSTLRARATCPLPSDGATTLPAFANMRLDHIKSVLQEVGVSFADCFDWESLTQQLRTPTLT